MPQHLLPHPSRGGARLGLAALLTATAGLAAVGPAAGADGPAPVGSHLAPLLGQETPDGVPGAAAVKDRYLVVLRADRPDVATTAAGAAASPSGAVSARTFDRAVARARSLGAGVGRQYRHALDGFAARLTAKQLASLRADPAVAYVSRDTLVHPTGYQSPVPSWGVDRVDQRTLPLDNRYSWALDGTGSTIYVVDSGIRFTHSEFGGRAVPGWSAISDGRGSGDCDGHGTQVASVAGGATMGLARNARLVSVRVFGCDGTGGTTENIVAALDWIIANRSGPSVANLSMAGFPNQALDDAVARAYSAGVTMVVAAGNYGEDACTWSPARVGQALTVGYTDRTDTRALGGSSSTSNYGPCVDLFAPGRDVGTATQTSDTSTGTASGSSFAAPAVAGAAAMYLQTNPNAMPWVVSGAITGTATSGVVQQPGTGSPNLMLYAPTVSTPPAPPNVTAQLRNLDPNTGDNQLKPALRLVNTGPSAVPLSSVTVRYWFTRETGATTFATPCDWAAVGCANVTRSVTVLGTPRTGADAYLQVGFTSGAGSLATGGSPGAEVQLRVNKTDWSVFTETNDYSYLAPGAPYAGTTKVTVYVNGQLAGGTEP